MQNYQLEEVSASSDDPDHDCTTPIITTRERIPHRPNQANCKQFSRARFLYPPSMFKVIRMMTKTQGRGGHRSQSSFHIPTLTLSNLGALIPGENIQKKDTEARNL